MICEDTQNFYGNANPLYASLKPPMLSHSALDIHCGYGTPIECPLDGYVYSVFNDVHKASDGYWAIYMICEYLGQTGELCIGHVSKINVNIGDKVSKGQIIGLEGNHGIVYDGATLITLAMQAKGDERGSHRHWQWRPLKKVKAPMGKCLTDFTGNIYTDKEGYSFQVPNYEDGHRGLSPLISEIIRNYSDFKFNKIILEKNIGYTSSPVTPGISLAQKTSLGMALENLKSILIAFKTKITSK